MGHPIGILVIHKPHDATFRLVLLVVYVMFIARPAIDAGGNGFRNFFYVLFRLVLAYCANRVWG